MWILCKMSEKMGKEKGNEHIAMQKFDYFRRFLAQVRGFKYLICLRHWIRFQNLRTVQIILTVKILETLTAKKQCLFIYLFIYLLPAKWICSIENCVFRMKMIYSSIVQKKYELTDKVVPMAFYHWIFSLLKNYYEA